MKKTIAAIFLVLAGGLTTPAGTLTVRQFRENPQYAHPVRIRGVVTSVAVDDLDDEWNWLVLNSDTDRLAAALLGILVWNLLLIRRSERRAGELVRERLARARADFRIGERTRLAVELHDSLSQSLSGASLQITASKCLRDSDPSAAAEHLDIAERILKSSRTELRRCLGDLRSDMLEDADFEHALRQAIAPVAASADCRVSFPVARTALPDTTAHAILRIVRELTANAVVHGHAAHVDISGSLRDDVLAFSVTDDGSGFDVARRAGPEQGHFGLDGIAERVRHLNGVFEITSTPGRGAKATITLHV